MIGVLFDMEHGARCFLFQCGDLLSGIGQAQIICSTAPGYLHWFSIQPSGFRSISRSNAIAM